MGEEMKGISEIVVYLKSKNIRWDLNYCPRYIKVPKCDLANEEDIIYLRDNYDIKKKDGFVLIFGLKKVTDVTLNTEVISVDKDNNINKSYKEVENIDREI